MLVLFLVMVWFTYPETKGLALEELGRLFEDDGAVGIVEKVDGIEPESEAEVVNVEMEEKT
jgi:hypothetical protein